MAKKSRLFDEVLAGATGTSGTLPPTDAFGNRRMQELSSAQGAAVERARTEGRLIAMVDPKAIAISYDLRDRDLDAARLDPDYAELLEDIRRNGIKEPIGVRVKQEGGLELVKGLRRLSAALELDIPKVPVIEGAYQSDDEYIEDMLRENMLRQNPPAMEVARLFARLCEDFGWAEERVAGLLKAKGGAISRLRMVARAFMPWLPDAYPGYRQLPIVEMAKIAAVVEQNRDRRSMIVGALQDLNDSGDADSKAVVDAIRTVAKTGEWKNRPAVPETSPATDAASRTQARAAFDQKGTKAALLTQHEGQMVIRFTKRVPDYLVTRVWEEVERLIGDIDTRE